MAEQQKGNRCMANENDTPDENTPLIPGSKSVATNGPAASHDLKSASQDKPSETLRSKLFVTVCILLTELCERLTFYGLTANLLLFCSEFLNFSSPWPNTITLLFQGTCYLVPLFGGWLADTYLGRFNVIYGSGLLYLLGTALLVVVSTTQSMFAELFGNETADLGRIEKRLFFGLALVMIALGTGGIKSNVSPFGADQVQHYGPRAVQRFFNWFYWFINVGSLGAFTVVVYVQQKYAFVYGYIITACTMLLAVILFFIGRNNYWNRPPGGSLLTDTAKVICQALANRKKVAAKNASSWLDRAKDTFGGSYTDVQVEDVKALLRVIPVFLTIIIYWMIYSQSSTSFLLQATYLKLKVGNFTVPAASLSIFDIVGVLALIPFMDHVVYPFLRYCGVRFTPLKRIAVGMLFAAAAVVVAGVVEIARKREMEKGHFTSQTVFNKTLNASNLNVFSQVPQFVLVGASEVLTSITGLEFAYSQAPKTLQGLVMGAFLVTSGLGSYAASLLAIIVRSASHEKWYPSENLNNGSLEYFFFLLAGLMLVNFLVFLLVARSYKYKGSANRSGEVRDDRRTVQPTDGDV